MHLHRTVTPEGQSLLHRLYRQSRHHQVRQRAHCLLLHSQGMTVQQLLAVFPVSQKTIYNWLNEWEQWGFPGLYNRPGRGRKPTFEEAQKAQIKQWAQRYPKQLKRLVRKAEETWGISVSTDTIKRVLKSLNMSWHRFRRTVGGQPDPQEYAHKRAALEVLKQLDEAGKIDLYYADESGFSQVPLVPSGWQPVGETIEIPSVRSRQQLNVLAFMHRRGRLESYVSEQSITSAVVILCIDTFFAVVDKPTVIVVDQASIHTSQAVQAKLEEWKGRNVYLFELPTYSPELNLAEILWRFMKYEWMALRAYESYQNLREEVEGMLRGFGKEFVINFA